MDASEILIEPDALDAAMAKGAILIDARKPGARNFIGSWHEWSSRPDLPVE